MLRSVDLVRRDVSEELSASIIRVMEALSSPESSVLTRATRCNTPEDAILHSHRRENLKPYTVIELFAKEFDFNLCFPIVWLTISITLTKVAKCSE
jgi:hypothetical protein